MNDSGNRMHRMTDMTDTDGWTYTVNQTHTQHIQSERRDLRRVRVLNLILETY